MKTLYLLIAAVLITTLILGVAWLLVHPLTSEPDQHPSSTASSLQGARPLAPPSTAPSQPPQRTQEALSPTEPSPPDAVLAVDSALVSKETLLATLEDLTAIEPYSGWRNSATQGESKALHYVNNQLDGLGYLHTLGMELERQEFRVFLGTELRDTRLELTVDGQLVEVPADGLRGPRDELSQAIRFDSDGSLNDWAPNPVSVQGPVVVIRTIEEIDSLGQNSLEGKVVFLDYATIDRIVQGSLQNAVAIATNVLAKRPAGLVLVTTFSNEPGVSHGSFVGDSSALTWVDAAPMVPTLYIRLEDLASADIQGWEDLGKIQAARLTWDADVFSPATSGNLVARIPGQNPSRAMILGAHIDSPNSPGAMDDGSGSAVLLEVARILNLSRTKPPTDLYLVWFGSEELGLYGSAHFVATHQELLDRTAAMLQTDMLSRPLDGIPAELTLVTWSYGRFGDPRLLWPDYLAGVAARRGLQTETEDYYAVYSDNSSFGGFGVPHADLIYADEQAMEATGSIHYAAHIHDPYDTVDLAREMGDVLVQMCQVALSAVLEPPSDVAAVRAAPRPQHRAVFVASHTEPPHMSPMGFTDLGMALAMEGFDVDLVPYGKAVTAGDLEDADLVFALPVQDYPSPDGNVDLYDDAWAPEEIAALEDYVAGGGLLVLTNSAHRLKYANLVLEPNEDAADMNALASRFGILFGDDTVTGGLARTEGNHPLVQGVPSLAMAEDNGVAFSLSAGGSGQVLATANAQPAVALVSAGDSGGQILVLADVGILGAAWGDPANLTFWQNLAQYAIQ